MEKADARLHPPAAGFCLSTSWKGWALRPYPDPIRNALTRIPYRLHPNGKHFIIRPIRIDRISGPAHFVRDPQPRWAAEELPFPVLNRFGRSEGIPSPSWRHLVMSSFLMIAIPT